MKTFETKNIIVELTEAELAYLQSALISAKIRVTDQKHEGLAQIYMDLFFQLEEIEQKYKNDNKIHTSSLR